MTTARLLVLAGRVVMATAQAKTAPAYNVPRGLSALQHRGWWRGPRQHRQVLGLVQDARGDLPR
jgi:hypothetical protein